MAVNVLKWRPARNSSKQQLRNAVLVKMHSACTTIHTSNFTKCPLGTEKLTMAQTLLRRLLNANSFNPRCGSSVTTPIRLNESKPLCYLKHLQFNVRFRDYSRQDKHGIRTWIFCRNTL